MKFANGMLVSIASGRQTLGPEKGYEVPDNLHRVTFRLSRATSLTPLVWPNRGTVLTYTLSMSLDGGEAWQQLVQTVTEGGIVTTRDQEIAEFNTETVLPSGTGRRIKVDLDITNGPIASDLTFEVN